MVNPSLHELDWVPYINAAGELSEQFQGKVGVYAIFNQEKVLQYIGFSRDVSLSLKQHLVRQPQQCYWVKVQTIDRPSRTILEDIRAGWMAENGDVPIGNGPDEPKWSQPINVKDLLTLEEQQRLATAENEFAQSKVLKQAARRVEADLLNSLKARGVQTEIRFNPKLKEEGLLDLK
jgi:hypothetical protein